MAGISDDEGDSRTASVGQARSQGPTNSGKKRSQKSHKTSKKDLQDLVPQGAKFSTTPLQVDPDSTSSSGPDSSNSDGEPDQNMNKRRKTNAPAINWNQASRSAIRTTLGAKPTAAVAKIQQAKSAFNAVNDKYFRSRSASISDGEAANKCDTRANENSTEAEEEPKTYFVDDSDASDSEDVSEGDDSMMLNIKQRSNGHGLDGAQDDVINLSTPPFVVDISPNLHPPQLDQQETQEDSSFISEPSITQLPPQSKAEAFSEFAASYKTSPAILADLKVKDLEIQARFFFYNSNINELDLTRPISCTECLQEGHLAAVCPSKECENCGAWNLHEDRLCPSVRRCQRCREIGHDSHTCLSSLKASAAETPCDYCGSDTHAEFDCDKLWKFPRIQPLDGPIKVSISCSYCTNKNHLFGDCPLKKVPTTSSTFSLKDYTPSVITNLNSVIGPKKADDLGMSIRGRAANSQNTLLPNDEDTLVLHGKRSQPNPRGGRGKITFRGGLGQNRGLYGEQPPPPPPGLPPLPREPPPPFQPRDYRDRDDGFNRQRRRSRSPASSHRPQPGSYSRESSGPRGRGGRGRGRGRGSDQYRPGRR
ncbi:zinc knuckle domain protein [Talaromyces stipitatus ATCC 10500]|uniref:Zinc knuckle domain protein n=1 Tax=Talaromyces stipitatus (strain ATCC 10500 / CBS 375.48 / QM 6759 / NRRL 1006) TaxID=441959 RepID=B8MBH6_TALSN|nr:zinc knuckle domain protein [Talaromyces stipitatus ATCC 10500]EED17840.1 zinc knuckle domain protein [Talaromyces stipitatus ATCC 10500]